MLIAGAGGFAGTCCRFLTGRLCLALWHGAFPLGTFAVNMLGCFAIGLFAGLLQRCQTMQPGLLALLITGFCGGFTTFSAFADDIFRLGYRDQWLIAAAYTAASIIIGIALVILGRYIAK